MSRPLQIVLALVALSVSARVDAQRVTSVNGEPVDGEAGSSNDSGETTEGTNSDGSAQDGTVQGDNVQNGTQQQGTYENGTPWADTEASLPSFLDTTDVRMEDTRPPPSSDQVAALRAMEQELERFESTAIAYRDTVVSLVRREYLRQRRGRSQWYDRQIREETRELIEARQRAIEELERFIARYPDDPTYTPDAMFRLGELYFERSAREFQENYDSAQARIDAGEEGVELPLQQDYTPTVELYQRLINNFPNYERRDGVLYLIGYCLNEAGKYEEALLAWRNLVCANRYTYSPEEFAAAQLAEAEAEAQAEANAQEESPLANVSAEEAVEAVAFVNPYAECQPVMEDAEFVSETWFRIGEYHFDDYGVDNTLDLAIAAYQHILEEPEDRNYNLALYKVAWAYYRDFRYPEAIEAFGQLVQWSDDEEARSGRAGSQLRPEAIEYLGITFAYDDWNENFITDEQEGLPRGIERIQDPELLPQDRTWTAEVYFQLGSVYFEEAKYPQAIEVWELALERWPNSPKAPEITANIARAYRMYNNMEAEIQANASLAQYMEGSDWWNANMDNPAEQRNAERLAEAALIETAIQQHQTAQNERRQCVEMVQGGVDGALELCASAQANYQQAADAYRAYLERYPNNPQAYELRYNLADALYWSENYEEAATEYAAVRDSNLDDVHLAESARRVVESLERIIEAAEAEGAVTRRTEPPEMQGTPPQMRAVEMPELVQRLAQARELYTARVSEEQDSEGVRATYEYNNAVLLYLYGYWPHAKTRFESILSERCTGPYANDTGRVAWESLRQMAIAEGNDGEIERLANELLERGCTFDPSQDRCPSGPELRTFCADPANGNSNCCAALDDRVAIEFRRGVQLYDEANAMEEGPERMAQYERAASMLLQAANENPGHEQTPLALEMVATALENTQRFDTARQMYQRIIDEVGPQTSEDPARQRSLDAIVANAYFQVGRNAKRGFEFDEAVENYRVLIDSRRFARSEDERVQRFRRAALMNTAILMEQLQRYGEAIQYYNDVIESPTSEPEDRRDAAYRIAEIAFNRGQWTLAVRQMRSFISRFESNPESAELVVQAYWRIAEARREARQTREYPGALQDVVQAFARSRQPVGSLAAEYAANARFLLADREFESMERFEISVGNPRVLEDYLQSLNSQIDQGSERANELKQGYDEVPPYQRPAWSVAALVQQGRLYEIVGNAILNAPVPFVLPRELAEQLRGQRLDQATRDELQYVIEDQVRMVLDERTRPIECLAVARYALAARAARVANMDTEYTRTAIDRLQAYGDERIAECIAEAQSNDSTFEAYTAGEFARAPRGQTRSIEGGIAPPSLEN